MHLPRSLARFNRRVTNPIQRRWAGTIPWHAIVEHTGRRSGRAYRTPVLAFHGDDGFVFLAGYGLESDWIRNLVAAGGGFAQHEGKRYRLTNVAIVEAPMGRMLLPFPIRVVAALARTGDVVTVTARRQH